MTYRGRRVFRMGPGMTLLFVAPTALFAAGAVTTYRASGWTWVSIGLAAATLLLGFGSIVESLILRIELADDEMRVTELTGRRRYAINDLERIEEARGCPPALLLKDGTWVTLPSVGSGLGNSVRAWLKRR